MDLNSVVCGFKFRSLWILWKKTTLNKCTLKVGRGVVKWRVKNEEFMWFASHITWIFSFSLNYAPSSQDCINIHFWGCMGAVSETHEITLWKHWFHVVKPRVSQPKTHGFTTWNPWFCQWKVSTLKSESNAQTFAYRL